MTDKNLDIWNKVNRPPASALKSIGGGRLRGMTDVNPQWRLQIMTEVFGQIGIGWYYDVEDMWIEQGHGGEVTAFVHIKLYTKIDAPEGWSRPISGIGGSMLVAQEKNGLYTSDEAFKMATTDALSVAMKQLGVAADIYAGLWDGSKYKDAPKEQVAAPDTAKELKVLNEAAKKGTESLRAAWSKLPDDVRVALKDKLAELKEAASMIDGDIANQP